MSYQKHTWVTKEIITATNLNNIEDGIYDEEQRALEAEEILTESVETLNGDSTTEGSVDYKIANAGYVTETDYATTSTGGVVMVDGSTITISGGVISATAATIDSELSDSSTNAVQNAVITTALADKVDTSTLDDYVTTTDYATSSTGGVVMVDDSTITITDGVISAVSQGTGTVTSIETGAGLTGGTITSSGTIKCDLQDETASSLTAATRGSTSGREYAVGIDASGDLSVNVPWTDTVSNDFMIGTSTSSATSDTLYFVYS